MRNYELTFVVASDVDDSELNGLVSQVQKWVEDSQGKVAQVNHWGRRRLAYHIDEYTEGFYVSFDMNMEPKDTAALERNLKLNEKVLRHLLIRAGE